MKNEAESPDGPYIAHHPNGKLYKKGSLLNGIRHGYWEVYYDTGKLMHKGTYSYGSPIGYWCGNRNTGLLPPVNFKRYCIR